MVHRSIHGLGLHDTINSSNGLILLEMTDTPKASQMVKDIEAIDGFGCQTMIFKH